MVSELLDIGQYPEIYADGIADVVFIGANVRLVLYQWRRVNGILQRCIAGEVVRPASSIWPALLAVWHQQFPQPEVPPPLDARMH